LAPYLVEEAHEAVEVLERLDAADEGHEDDEDDNAARAALRSDAADELGDVLLQVLFHARVAAEDEQDPFDVDDVAAALAAKLVRRPPPAFADTRATAPADVEASWEQIKAAEQPHREHPLDGIPTGMPSLARAAKVASRLDRAGRSGWLDTWVAEQVDSGDPGAALLRLVLDLRARGT